MENSRSKVVIEMKTASQLWAEEEARVVAAEAKAALDAKIAARAKAEEEAFGEAARERARVKAKAAADARAAEEARIAAAASDEWYYLLDGEQVGPVSLATLKEKIADLSIRPPLKMVWTEGMEDWRPVYEVRMLCDPLPETGLKVFEAAESGSEEQEEPEPEAVHVFQAAPDDTATNIRHAEEVARARDAEDARIAALAEARAQRETIAKAEMKVRAEAEAKAFAEAKIRAKEEAKAKLAEQARLKALAKAEAAEQAKAAEAIAKAEAAALKRAEEEAMAAQKAAEVEQAAAPVIPDAKPEKKKKISAADAKAIWFYTFEGERLGPVSFEQLRSMAAGSSLDPRLDLVWKKDMAEWKPAGQIDGLFQRTAVPAEVKERKETKAAPAAVSRAPKKTVRLAAFKDQSWPGARRRSLLLVMLVFPFVWNYLLSFAGPMATRQFGPVIVGKVLPVAALLPFALLAWFVMKRLVNLGMSRMWCLGLFAPFVNLWVGYRCLACPAGYAYQKKLDGPGVALAALYWMVTLPCALLLTITVALIGGAINSPVLQQHAREALRFANGLVTLVWP